MSTLPAAIAVRPNATRILASHSTQKSSLECMGNPRRGLLIEMIIIRISVRKGFPVVLQGEM